VKWAVGRRTNGDLQHFKLLTSISAWRPVQGRILFVMLMLFAGMERHALVDITTTIARLA
jgi:hypothetical protein